MEEDDAVVGESIFDAYEIFDDLFVGVFAIDEDEGVFFVSAGVVEVLWAEAFGYLYIEPEAFCDALCEC